MTRFGVLILITICSFSLFAAGHDLTLTPPARDQFGPVLTGNESGFIAAWIERVPPSEGARNLVVSRAVTAGGEPIEDSGASVDQEIVWPMAIAHSPSETLIVWIADRILYAQRLSASGAPRSTVVVSSDYYDYFGVAAAWNGSRYFVVWSKAYQLYGAFIGLDGSTTQPHLVFSEPYPPQR